mgnify:CR=1 FL=1
MLIDLLSPSNYINFNIKVAEVIGLHPAIYLSELMNINNKAIRKTKTNEDDNSFVLDREYVRSRTTLTAEEQLDIEKNLIKIGILEKPSDDDNRIVLNINVLTTLLMSNDEELISNVKNLEKLKKKSSRTTKADIIKNSLRENIVTTNPELRAAYSEWIDAIYAKQGYMSKKCVIEAQAVVDNFSQRNLDVALRVVDLASIHSYRDMNWAINKYNQEHTVNYVLHPPKQATPRTPTKTQLSDEVF